MKHIKLIVLSDYDNVPVMPEVILQQCVEHYQDIPLLVALPHFDNLNAEQTAIYRCAGPMYQVQEIIRAHGITSDTIVEQISSFDMTTQLLFGQDQVNHNTFRLLTWLMHQDIPYQGFIPVEMVALMRSSTSMQDHTGIINAFKDQVPLMVNNIMKAIDVLKDDGGIIFVMLGRNCLQDFIIKLHLAVNRCSEITPYVTIKPLICSSPTSDMMAAQIAADQTLEKMAQMMQTKIKVESIRFEPVLQDDQVVHNSALFNELISSTIADLISKNNPPVEPLSPSNASSCSYSTLQNALRLNEGTEDTESDIARLEAELEKYRTKNRQLKIRIKELEVNERVGQLAEEVASSSIDDTRSSPSVVSQTSPRGHGRT